MILDSIRDHDALRREFARWTFQMPGVRWHLDDGMCGPLLRIYVETRNSYRPDEPTTVMSVHAVPAAMPHMMAMDPTHFGRWLRSCVHATLIHEADEWLRCDGEMVFDPHAREKQG